MGGRLLLVSGKIPKFVRPWIEWTTEHPTFTVAPLDAIPHVSHNPPKKLGNPHGMEQIQYMECTPPGFLAGCIAWIKLLHWFTVLFYFTMELEKNHDL